MPVLPHKHRIAILIETSTSWGRGIISGVHACARVHPEWQLFVEARGRDETLELPRGWHCDGIIARIGDEAEARYLRSTRLPVVNVSALQVKGPQFPRVATDVKAAGEMAVKYFIERGFRHFGYLSLLGLECVGRQRRAFGEAVKAAGFRCEDLGIQIDCTTQQPEWTLGVEELSRWLVSLPKPVAILTWNGGREVIECCAAAGIAVPEEVALLSGSDDDLLCEVCNVPISAVRQPVEQIGLQAATLLDRLIRGKAAERTETWVQPLSVISRQSTNIMAIADRSVASALSYIGENAHRPMLVSEVAGKVGVSPRVLERRFAEHLHRSPAECIRRSHLDCAKNLLAMTDRPISSIAEASGFPSQQYLSYILRRETGLSPLKYRRQARAGLR
ncbi:MAG TPA: DNA-binding transcriptional regulator [Chthoniobacteraceae bacterium]|jgi:LacI family transcriptional regulator|nr:DNA-binding transcriptional regulator [Chthoniobacteraceae bacterium]